MAATGQSFGISLGVYAAWLCLMMFIFSLLRKQKYFVRCPPAPGGAWVRRAREFDALACRFFCAKRFMSETDQPIRPRPLSNGFLAWVMPTWRATEDDVILTAGVDGAMYLRIFAYGELLPVPCVCAAAVVPAL